MATRAKFSVGSVAEYKDADGKTSSVTVKLYPVYGTAGEDKSFWNATPAGTIEMNITNPDAYEQFRPGQKFYVDFTPAEPPTPQAE